MQCASQREREKKKRKVVRDAEEKGGLRIRKDKRYPGRSRRDANYQVALASQ